MKVLVIGSGGRESAIVWALAKDKAEIICAPGNPGMEKYGRCVSIKADDIESLLNFAEKERVDLTQRGRKTNGVIPSSPAGRGGNRRRRLPPSSRRGRMGGG